jgi:hypothetical protein
MRNPWTGEDPDRGLKPLDSTLEIVLERVTEGRLAAFEVIKQAWRSVVGSADADRSQPIRLSKGVLLVEVADGTTASKLRLRQGEIREALGGLIGRGEVAQIKFRVRRSQTRAEAG